MARLACRWSLLSAGLFLVIWQALSVGKKKAGGGRTLSFGFLFSGGFSRIQNFSQDPLQRIFEFFQIIHNF